MPEIKTFYLPRLSPEAYTADAVVHWTLTLFDRTTGWLNASFHAQFRELMLHLAAREGLLCPVYCLMPDHLHLVWMGLRPDTDQLHGMAFLRTHLAKSLRPFRFQKQAHDHVLRADEREQDAFARVCAYVLNNPARGRLADRPDSWPYSGAVVAGYPTLHPFQDRFWEIFWKIYWDRRDPECDRQQRPPLTAG